MKKSEKIRVMIISYFLGIIKVDKKNDDLSNIFAHRHVIYLQKSLT